MDGTPPRIELSDTWYIWETGEVTVRDKESGLTGVEIEIRDPQNRWPKVSRAYEASGERFTITITWDRHFGDGTLAPIGAYEVVVKAFDRAGNMERVTAHILIPAPGVTPTPLPTRTPIPMATATATLPVSSSLSLPAQPAPTATRAPTIHSFQSPNLPIPQSSNPPSTVPNSSSSVPPSSFPLWGAAAAAAIGAATAYALEQRRKRKEEEARQRAEAQAEAARRNAAEEARKAQASLLAQIAAQQAAQQQTAAHRGQDAKIERMEEAEGAALAAAKAAKPERDEQAYQDYRVGERNAEAVAAEYQTRKAVQEYRQGERAVYAVRQERDETAKSRTKDIPAWRKTLSKLTSIGALALDITSLAISSSGVLLETIFTALGLAEPTPGGGEIIGFRAGVTLYNTVLNPIENWLSARSAFLVTVSDVLAGNTRLEQAIPFPGIHATELVIGQDTLVAWGGIAFGNTPLTPEAFTDTVVNAGIVYYDVQRLREQIPDYVSCRIGRTEGGTLYLRCLSTGDE